MNDDVKKIIANVVYGTLCTVGPNDQPLGTIVRFAEKDGYLIWRSQSSSEHSRNIEINSQIAITLYDSSQAIPGGVYIESYAEKLIGDEQIEALAVYAAKFEDPNKLGDDAEVYRAKIGEKDDIKTKDKRFYFKVQDRL